MPATHVTSQVLQHKSVHKRYRGRHTFISLYFLPSMSVGRISESEFDESLTKFVEISSKLFDDWKIIDDEVKIAF